MRTLLAAAIIAALSAAVPLQYPAAPRGEHVDTYFGTQVPDPYRWMEDIDAPQTRTWVEAEAHLSQQYLSAIPQRAEIYKRLRAAYNYPKHGAPFHYGSRYFFTANTGLQNQSVLFTENGPKGAPRVLLDPNKLSSDGTVSVGGESFTQSGKLMAYGLQNSGSDWETWHVRNVATGKDYSDVLQWTKFSDAAWVKDDSGFYYERYPKPKAGEEYKAASVNPAVYFHKLGTPQSADTLFYARPDHPDWNISFEITHDGAYGLIYLFNGTSQNNGLAFVDMRDPKHTVHDLFPIDKAAYLPIDAAGSTVYLQTTENAPNGRVISIDLKHPGVEHALIPESASALQGVSMLHGRLIASYLQDGHSAVRVYDLNGRFVRDVDLPGIGTAQGFGGQRADRVTYYSYSGYTTPPRLYSYDVVTGKSTLYWQPHIKFDAARYATKLVFYKSTDGTRVPMEIAYRKGIALDGSHPAILYGYGGFDLPMTPHFSTFVSTWLDMGGIYAVANLRGGSEYGERWHHAGMLANKQNVFDDFIAAAKYLIAQRYTSTPKLAIKGESNGGLLVGAVETQRPDLFGAALPGVGVMDMLRFDKFTVGHGWVPEYGCATCSSEQFKTLLAYSPYQNVKKGTAYPPTLISTADHDDRVFPAHSFKFAAAMQWAQAGPAPVLLRVDSKSGHGGGKPISKIFDDYADSYAFLVKNLHMTLPKDF
jgi:prolyl oligopeptidase